MKRNAFTMIELVFVIVILGILASVAVPKFLETKDQANAVKEVSNLRTAINDIQAQFMLTDSNASLSSFDNYQITCFDYYMDNNGTMLIKDLNVSNSYCSLAVKDANKSGLLGSRKF